MPGFDSPSVHQLGFAIYLVIVIYLVRNKVNQKVYVGQTSNFEKRRGQHLWYAENGHEGPLYRSIRKHGIENFSFEVVEECSEENVSERERHWISSLDSNDSLKGYNLTEGGEGARGCRRSPETRRRMSEAHKGKTISEAHRQKISDAKKGKKFSEEHRANLTLAKIGKKRGPYRRKASSGL